jgi:GntR family transcriptional regulator/MocR family aminotransferase
LSSFEDRIEVLGDEGGLHVVVRGRTHEIDYTLQAALHAKAILFDTIRQFSTTCSDTDGFLLAYGHMNPGMLKASLNVLESCLNKSLK